MSSIQQYRRLVDGAGLTERAGRGRLRLSGNDRRDYLQGLLTNDVAALTPGTGCYSAFLTAQGRMITDMRVWELGDALLMELPLDLTPGVRDRFEQFVFSEDVTIEDVSPALAQLGLYGAAAARVAAAVLSADEPAGTGTGALEGLLPFANRSWRFDGVPVIVAASDELGVRGFDVFVDRGQAERLAGALVAAGAERVADDILEVLRIEAGRPAFHADMTEDTIPLEAGIEDRAISQTKGCYVGQEIIIRVLHRGHGRVARRLVGLTLDGAAPVPAAGDRLFAGDRDIGAVTSATRSLALDRPIALGYVHRDFTEPGTEVAIDHAAARLPSVVTRLPFVARG
jgi:folate-binding protein YgfZ